VQLTALRQVTCLLYVVFELDSEFLIKTPLSYKLNSVTLGTFTLQNGIVAEVIGVTKRLHTVEKTGSLDDLLLSVVDDTMKQVFAETGAKVIYDFLGNNSHLKREEITEKTEVFSAGLERLMGSGAPVIEKLVLKNLYSKLELKFEEKEGCEFSDYIKELRKRCRC